MLTNLGMDRPNIAVVINTNQTPEKKMIAIFRVLAIQKTEMGFLVSSHELASLPNVQSKINVHSNILKNA